VSKKEFFQKKTRAEGGIAFKKPKLPKIPVYSAAVQPAQLLNEVIFKILIKLFKILDSKFV
jgi:hypothetical protein